MKQDLLAADQQLLEGMDLPTPFPATDPAPSSTGKNAQPVTSPQGTFIEGVPHIRDMRKKMRYQIIGLCFNNLISSLASSAFGSEWGHICVRT